MQLTTPLWSAIVVIVCCSNMAESLQLKQHVILIAYPRHMWGTPEVPGASDSLAVGICRLV